MLPSTGTTAPYLPQMPRPTYSSANTLAAALVLVGAVLAQAQTAPAGPIDQDAFEVLQLALIMAEDGDTVRLPSGVSRFGESLLVDGVDDLVIVGAGRGETVLQFSGQAAGAEGLKVTNCDNVTLAGFTILDTAGDAIKAQGCAGIAFVDVETSWTGAPRSTNGSYGLYPVQCSGVRIEGCRARGASDAGIYVGQSEDIVVRDCEAVENVAGIEIENSTDAEVYGNVAVGNTGGILVFDLPGLVKKSGGNVRVYGNDVRDNNLDNFAPAGNIVAQVPAGTGVMVLATSDVDIYDNDIAGHRTASVAVVSYYVTELPIQDEGYDPIPTHVRVRDNRITRRRQWPSTKHDIGKLLALKFRRRVPPILYDGITAEVIAGGAPAGPWGLCVAGNGVDFVNLDLGRGRKHLERNPDGFDCAAAAAPELTKADRR